MRYIELFETPIEIENRVTRLGGEWDDPAAFKWARSSKAHTKVIQSFGDTPFHIKLILADVDWKQHGVIDPETEPDADALEIFPATPGVITFVLTGNWLGQHPLSPWMVAHRLGHGMLGYHTRDVMPESFHDFHEFSARLRELEDAYRSANPDKPIWSFFSRVGTMRSARKDIILNESEFFHELFAQYLLTGRVRLNMLPGIEQQTGDLVRYLETMFQDDLESMLGKLVIM